MSKVITVLLTDAEEFPKHRAPLAITGSLFGGWPKWRGNPIRILANPVTPVGWTCDTDFVWPVLRDEVEKIWPACPTPERVFVCRHQIQIGD